MALLERNRALMIQELDISVEGWDRVITRQIFEHRDSMDDMSQRACYRWHLPFNSRQNVCENGFRFATACSESHLRLLIAHVIKNGDKEYQHLLTGQRSNHSFCNQVELECARWLLGFAKDHVVACPARLDCHSRLLILENVFTYADIYEKFSKSWSASPDLMKLTRERVPSEAWFRARREHILTFCKKASVRTNVCDTCFDLRLQLSQAIARKDDDKRQAVCADMAEHRERADAMRRHYNAQCTKYSDQPTVAAARTVVLNFDYSSAISLPHLVQQPARQYYLTGYRIQLFGIWEASSNSMVTFFLPEHLSTAIKKGANSVIGCLHSYLETLEYEVTGAQTTTKMKPDHVIIWADNCYAQNKNHALIRYLAWRVAMGHNKSMTLNFMAVGHTKFAPDRFFGKGKQCWASSEAETVAEALEAWRRSCEGNMAVDARLVDFYNWEAKLHHICSRFPDISKKHHFYFSSEHPWEVQTAENHEQTSTDRPWTTLLKRSLRATGDVFSLPLTNLTLLNKEIGITKGRLWYIFRKLRELVRPEKHDADSIWSQPLCAEVAYGTVEGEEVYIPDVSLPVSGDEARIAPVAEPLQLNVSAEDAGAAVLHRTPFMTQPLPSASVHGSVAPVVADAPEQAKKTAKKRRRSASAPDAQTASAVAPQPSPGDDELTVTLDDDDVSIQRRYRLSTRKDPIIVASARGRACLFCDAVFTEHELSDGPVQCLRCHDEYSHRVHLKGKPKVVPQQGSQLTKTQWRTLCRKCYEECSGITLDRYEPVSK